MPRIAGCTRSRCKGELPGERTRACEDPVPVRTGDRSPHTCTVSPRRGGACGQRAATEEGTTWGRDCKDTGVRWNECAGAC